MKAGFRFHISGHLFVAIKAKLLLGTLRKTLMAITALFLQISMAFDQVSGHYEAFKNTLGLGGEAQENESQKRGKKAEELGHISKDARLKHGPTPPIQE